MEAFSLLKFWRISTADDATVGGGGGDDIAIFSEKTSDNKDGGRNQAVETDDEESFFDLEFTVPGCDDKDQAGSRDVDINISDRDEDTYDDAVKKDGETRSNYVESPSDAFKGGVLPLESNSKPQSPISFLRSPPKFPVFMLFKKPKLEKPEAADISPATSKHHQRQSKRFSVKCKVDEVPIFSLLTRVNSSRSKLRRQSSQDASSKRFPKDVVHKYLKLIKPLYVRVSKRYSNKLKFSDEFSTPLSSPTLVPVRSPIKQAEEKVGSRAGPRRGVCKQLGKSRSASSAAGIMPLPASKRDDSLQLQHDGIQSAILHCKKSYNSSREFSVLSRSASDPSREIAIHPSRNSISTEEELKKRSSI